MTSSDMIDEVIAAIRKQIKEAEDDDAPKYQISALYGRLQTAIDRRIKLDGDEITEAQILRSKAWREMFTRLLDVLSRHPEALADVVSSMQRRGSEPNE